MTRGDYIKRILITGATGFVGKHLMPHLDRKRYKLALIVRDRCKAEKLFGKRHIYITLNERRATYKKKIKKFNPEICIHLASYLTSKSDTNTLKRLLNANIRFGSLLLDAFIGTDIRYFVNTGSFSEYSENRDILDPAYLYSATKVAFRPILDFYRKMLGFKVIHVIPYTIYGPGDKEKKAINYIINSTNSSKPFNMTQGSQFLDFVYITDVVNFYISLLRNIQKVKNGYTEYHLGTGVGTSIRDVARIIEKICNKKTNIKWGILPYRDRDVMHAVAPIAKVFKDLRWKARISLREGLMKILNLDGRRSGADICVHSR